MIHSAKILANRPSDKENFLVWANCNEKVNKILLQTIKIHLKNQVD